MAKNLDPKENKFHQGNGDDGKHYWLTPPKLMEALQLEFNFDFDPCPFPKPDDFDGLTCEWGNSNYVNPPFGSIMHNGKKKGMTAWVRKAISEQNKGKRIVMVYPIDKWVLMLVAAGAKISNLGDIKWVATEDGSAVKGTGRHIAQFVLEPNGFEKPEEDGKKLKQLTINYPKSEQQEFNLYPVSKAVAICNGCKHYTDLFDCAECNDDYDKFIATDC